MRKILATCAGLTLIAAFALPVPAVAAEKRADGVRNAEQTDVSSQRRRYRRNVYRSGPRYGYYRQHYYNAPYYAYAPQPYYRPYYGPRVGVGVGPFGFGLGW